MDTIAHLRAVLTGPAVPYTRPGSMSGIAKRAVTGPVQADTLGLHGDAQGDLRVHGGPDKAVHAYAWSHYAHWQAELPGHALLQAPGAFGENFSLDGLDESDVCIADQWQVGTARFEVSQGRQPCWKLNERFDVPDMARRVQDSLRAGWYLRVLQPGMVQAGDAIHRIARPHAGWPLLRLLAAIRDRDTQPALLREILTLPLPPSWQRLFARRLDSGDVESWDARLAGPTAR